uniref:DNA excision repair protein ERCC-6-like n=1 Tax=Sphenodon punctatus TaxID=8508 RepID=A0A8D0L4A6_SPHPU
MHGYVVLAASDLANALLLFVFYRYVTQAKEEAKNGNLEESLKLFSCAHEIHPNEKLRSRIRKLEQVLAELALDPEEEEEDGFVNVCQSGLMLYGELHNKLYDYQREGVAFLYSLYRDGRKGGILADDMGLGKTIQIVAFLSGMFDAELAQFVLLVVPTTLISTWVREFAKWTPGMRVKDFHGTNKAERNRNLQRIQRKTGVVITSYPMLLNNWQQLSSLNGQEFIWDYIILDEAHKIKSPSAKTTKCIHVIPAKNRILLTGTPMQNNLHEMWSLFDFACQGSLLGTAKTFKMEYETPITKAREKDSTPTERALGLKISENLMSIIKPYFLRRTKEDIQKKNKFGKQETQLPENQSKDIAPEMPALPRKNDFIVWVYLAPVQEQIYKNFLSLDYIKELLMTTRSPLSELTVLKKLCDHPRLLSARACSQLGLEGSNFSEQDGEENDVGAFSGMNKIDHLSDDTLIEESGKLRFLIGLLERLREEGHRTLVFSQSRKMLDILERILAHKNFKLMRIDGTVAQLVERERRIGIFQNNEDYSVFLLTTQVGGVGLTLTAATRVVIFDPSWNPATDAQAVDRAYRIGQKENVLIYRLITCGTVEEKIYRRQVFKDSLIRQTTGDKKNPFRYFTKQELRELFTLRDTRTSATQLQLQSLHAMHRKTDPQLDEHIAYLHLLEMFGISDHDLMYTQDLGREEPVENIQYIHQRVQKAQELVQLESQLRDQLLGRVQSETEGAWLRQPILPSYPKKKLPEYNNIKCYVFPPGSESTNNECIDNVDSKMTCLVIEDSEEEGVVQDVPNMDVKTQDRGDGLEEEGVVQLVFNMDVNKSLAKSVDLEEEGAILNVSNMAVKSLEDSEEEGVVANMDFKQPSRLVLENANTSFIKDQISSSQHSLIGFTCTSGRFSLENGSVESSSHFLPDFNLVLGDSCDSKREALEREELLECTDYSGFELKLDSHCSSAVHSWAREQNLCKSPHGNENIVTGSMNDSFHALMPGDITFGCKKKSVRRIVSDREDEDLSVIILDDNLQEKSVSSLNSPPHPSLKAISASTPKCDTVIRDSIFSPRVMGSGNRSTASRRSLLSMVMDQMEETIESANDGEAEEELVEEAEMSSYVELEEDLLPQKELKRLKGKLKRSLQRNLVLTKHQLWVTKWLRSTPLRSISNLNHLPVLDKILKEHGKLHEALNFPASTY